MKLSNLPPGVSQLDPHINPDDSEPTSYNNAYDIYRKNGDILISLVGTHTALMGTILAGQGWRYSKTECAWLRADVPAGSRALLIARRMLDDYIHINP